jgi:hypothetical protein
VPRILASLSDERFNRVLYLHMAALASVEGLAFEANTLMEVILDHEERFWAERARQSGVAISLGQSLARQMVAAATLRGGISDSAAASTLAGRLIEGPISGDERKLLLLLQRIYQRRGQGPAVFLPALEPDLLGEGMVLRVASPKLEGERLPPDWIDRVFPPDEEGSAVGTGLEVLGRISATQPDLARPWMERLLAGPIHLRAPLALEAARAAGLRTAFSLLGDVLADRLEKEGGVETARTLEDLGIPEATVSLGRVAEWTSRTLLQALSESGEEGELAERARLLNNLGNRLSKLGRREEALEATREAVEIRRALAQRNPDAFRPDLATSLNNLGNRLSELGRREEALEATEEAADMLWPLFEQLPSAFAHNIAVMLRQLQALHQSLQRPLPPLLQERVATFMRRVER